MQELILELDKDNEYVAREYTKKTFFYLVNFLHNIEISSIPFYFDWALNTKEKEQGAGNTAYLIKKNNKIFIGFLYSDEPDREPFFEISIDQFIKLLKEWEKLVNDKMQKITITENNGVITIKGE